MTYELCFPSDKTIIKQVKEAVKKYKAKTVFVATDERDMMKELGEALKKKVGFFLSKVFVWIFWHRTLEPFHKAQKVLHQSNYCPT